MKCKKSLCTPSATFFATSSIAINAGAGAVTGAVGAAVIKYSGYQGYDILEAMLMGTVGGAVWGIPMTIFSIFSFCINIFNVLQEEESSGNKKIQWGIPLSTILKGMLIGLVGFRLTNLYHPTQMELEQTAITFAVGSAFTAIPASVILTCCILPLVLGSAYLIANPDSEITVKALRALPR